MCMDIRGEGLATRHIVMKWSKRWKAALHTTSQVKKPRSCQARMTGSGVMVMTSLAKYSGETRWRSGEVHVILSLPSLVVL
jgi:hypothetical protein